MEEEERKPLWLFVIRILVTVGLVLLGTLYLNESNFPWWVNLLVMGAAYLVIAYDIILEMIEKIFEDHVFFDESTLMVLASLGAFAIRLYGKDHNEYLEGVLVILLFQIGEFLEDLAADKTKEAIVSALDLRQEEAIIENGNSVTKKKPEELCIGEIITVGVGMKILCDGEVVEGKGSVDESSLTGEAMPRAKEKGSIVYSGTILHSGSLKVRVSKEYKDSTVAKLLELVTNNAEKKSRATRFITKFSRVYTPIVSALALLVAVVPPLFLGVADGAVWARWIYVALSFLIVSCPCAVVISVPLAYFSGLGLASKHGILVKGAGYFDQANELKTIAFDKTGTLTKGKFTVTKIAPKNMEKEDFLQAFAIAVSRSSHPIAKAISEQYKGEWNRELLTESEEIMGIGTRVEYAGQIYEVSKSPRREENRATIDIIGSISYLILDGEDAGYIVLRDEAKPQAKAMIEMLKKQGIKTVLLSGDKKANVDYVASRLGLDESYGELSPADKTNYVEKLMQSSPGSLAFMGDGINDAPTLVLADIGIAMGGLGSDLAVSNADVVFLNDDPGKIVTLLDIASKTKKRALACVIFALAVKLGIMVASMIAASMGSWALPLWVSVVGDTGVALLCVLLALLNGKRKVKTL